MTRYRWQLVAAVLILAGFLPYVRPTPVQAQGASIAVPKDLARPEHFTEWAPGAGRFVSTVDNFAGIVAVANIQGTGKDNAGNTLLWEVDVRAIQGVYLDPGGVTQRGTFGFA
jgi:hypothetical protein